MKLSRSFASETASIQAGCLIWRCKAVGTRLGGRAGGRDCVGCRTRGGSWETVGCRA
jgi:hypothetical protein